MAKLYPPVIEGTIPAFNGTTLVVPFSMNRSVSASQIGGFAVKIKTVQTSTWITTLTNGHYNAEKNVAEFNISELWTPTPGQYYKLQLAYIYEGEVGYFSTVGIVKYTAITTSNLQVLANNTVVSNNASMLYPFKYTYTGVYDYSDDPMEKLYNYRFCIYDESDNIVQDSGVLLHNATQDSLNTAVDTYTFLDDLEADATFYLEYTITTVNGLELTAPRINLTAAEELTVSTTITLNAEVNYNNGYIGLTAVGALDDDGVEEYISGKFRIYRQNIDYPKRWEPVFSFVLQNEHPSSYTWKDFTIEHGKTYKYKICQFNDNNILATIDTTEEVYADFEDMFLFDGERQLKIQYNPKVSSFKNDILESKLDTIGSKYPFFFRNGHVNYKEFPISGLISYWMDDEGLFLSLSDLGIEDVTDIARRGDIPDNFKTTDLSNYNIAAERKFKLDALEWLTNGKPKLFRSPTEGNYIVRLMNTSLSPNDTVGRMLHTFNSTAYEIDDCSYNNLSGYGFISGEYISNDTKRLRFRTVRLRDLIPVDEDGDSSTSIYTYDSDGYIEILKNPYGSHGAITAQSVRIEDCEYGDKFKINDTTITIGSTQTYSIDGPFQITSIKFNPNEVAALQSTSDDYSNTIYNPIITYSYYDTFNGVALFDNIQDIVINSIPARQFMKTNETMYTDNLVNEIEDIKTTVTQYNQILLELRPVEEIYTIVDLSTSGGFSSWFKGEGIPASEINALFTFDKTGWGKGRSSMSGAYIAPSSNTVSGSTPAEVLKQMPFYIFKVLPTTILSTDIAERFRTYRAQILLAADQAGITITDQDLIDLDAETLIAKFSSAPSIQISVEYTINNFKALQADNPLTIGSSAQFLDYVQTHDTERDNDYEYYVQLSSVEENGDIYTTYVEYTGEFPIPDDAVVYKRVLTTAADNATDLYINLDYDKFTYDKDYYFYYDTDTDKFKLFDGGEYCTKVYFNTGELNGLALEDGIPTTTTDYVDVAESAQPELYLRVDKLTDMYIGNGVMATLGYTYSTTTYSFESEQAISKLKATYENAVKRYNSETINRSNTTYYDKETGAGYGYKDYDDETLELPDPSEWKTLKTNSNSHQQYIKKAYSNFITALTARINEWKEANEGNEQ